MLAADHVLCDVAIHWPRSIRAMAAIRRSGRCPSRGVPRRLRVPGGLVALVDTRGEVLLVFRIARIEEGVSVIAANRKRYERGCVLVAQPGTIRTPGRRDPKVLNVSRYGLGAFAYFDAKTHERVVYDLTGNARRRDQANSSPQPFPSRHYPLFSNNIGKALSQPERRLIRDYVSWVGDVGMFVHHPLKETGLYTDLFIPRRWTLLEAKASMARRVLREAVGQLFDYQRHYDRSPRLAVLLPERPPRNVMGLFERKRIVAVWRSRGSTFRDSADGALTSELRAAAR